MNERRMLKYRLFDMGQVTNDEVTIRGPWPTTSQHIAMQGTWITLWVLTGEMLPERDRTFIVFGTGHIIQGELNYVGTVQDRQFIWHVFEKFA